MLLPHLLCTDCRSERPSEQCTICDCKDVLRNEDDMPLDVPVAHRTVLLSCICTLPQDVRRATFSVADCSVDATAELECDPDNPF